MVTPRAAAPLALAVAAALMACAPRVAVRPGEGDTVFLYDGPADEVLLLASWMGWRSMPLRREGREFVLAVPVPAGRHELRLEARRGGARWVVLPPGMERVSDGYGGENVVLRAP